MTKKVWHIFRFRQRYELPDDIRFDRETPLIYTKDFVGSGRDDESCGYFRQKMALRSKSNWAELLGYFSELKNVAGNMSKEYRGYLLDSNFEPASILEIGRWLSVNKKKAERIVGELSDVGMIEKVALPQFSGQPRKRTSRPVKKRKRPGKSGKARAPLKNKTKKKVKAKTKKNGKGKDKEENKKRQTKDVSQHKDVPQEPSPSTTQPIKPQSSAKGGRLIQFNGPSKLKNTELLGSVAKKMLHRYNPQSKQFAYEIYQALELSWDPTSEEGKRELGSFASTWQKVTGVPPPALEELRDRAITEARKIAKRKQNRKRGAVWNVVFGKLEVAYKQRDYQKCVT